jgi:hypothetical protein
LYPPLPPHSAKIAYFSASSATPPE